MRTQRLKQSALVLATPMLLYAAAGFLLAPWLARMLREQAGADAARQLDRECAGPSDASDAGRRLYEAMFEKIVAPRAVGEGATQLLAAQRARASVGHFVQQGVGRERGQTGRIAAVQDGSPGAVSAQLQIAAASATR